MKALYFKTRENNRVQCTLCPHNCLIEPGQAGKCRVRHNKDGILQTDVYNNVSALSVDPVEKKPLYHFYPGYDILSVGSFGCNMSCVFCQNHDISQPSAAVMRRRRNEIGTAEIIKEAKKVKSNAGLAFTYNEPVVWFEFMKDLAVMAQEEGLSTVMVSNGFVNKKPLDELTAVIDAFNIDLKAFNDHFYRKLTGSAIKPVLNTLQAIRAAGRHLEITYLVIPGNNDDREEFSNAISWIDKNLGSDTVLHLSRYFPSYNFDAPATTASTIKDMYDIASAKLDYVYPGNIMLPGSTDTLCPACGTVISTRKGYGIKHLNTLDGSCSECGHRVYRHFKP
ncbi:MAG: AmmeMemoRadiSam system radical SAM enzyme [Bacteroidales bacterium]